MLHKALHVFIYINRLAGNSPQNNRKRFQSSGERKKRKKEKSTNR